MKRIYGVGENGEGNKRQKVEGSETTFIQPGATESSPRGDTTTTMENTDVPSEDSVIQNNSVTTDSMSISEESQKPTFEEAVKASGQGEEKDINNSKKREATFSKANKYLEKLIEEMYSILDEESSGNEALSSVEYWEKLEEDLEEEGIAVVEVCSSSLWLAKMEEEKDEQLEILIEKNNNGELDKAAVIKFLSDLYNLNYWRFKDFDSSWQSSLDYIHENSNNEGLLDLMGELFPPVETQ